MLYDVLAAVFYAKIVHYKTKGDGPCGVALKTWFVLCWDIPVGFEVFLSLKRIQGLASCCIMASSKDGALVVRYNPSKHTNMS